MTKKILTIFITIFLLSFISAVGYCNPNLPGGQNCPQNAVSVLAIGGSSGSNVSSVSSGSNYISVSPTTGAVEVSLIGSDLNTTINQLVSAGSGDNSSWNQSFANTLYSNIQWNYNQSSPFYSWLSSFLYDYNQTTPAENYADTLYTNIQNNFSNYYLLSNPANYYNLTNGQIRVDNVPDDSSLYINQGQAIYDSLIHFYDNGHDDDWFAGINNNTGNFYFALSPSRYPVSPLFTIQLNGIANASKDFCIDSTGICLNSTYQNILANQSNWESTFNSSYATYDYTNTNIVGNLTRSLTYTSTNDVGNNTELKTYANTNILGNLSSGNSPWKTSATTIYNDTSGILVGIGTNNPTQSLTVNGGGILYLTGGTPLINLSSYNGGLITLAESVGVQTIILNGTKGEGNFSGYLKAQNINSTGDICIIDGNCLSSVSGGSSAWSFNATTIFNITAGIDFLIGSLRVRSSGIVDMPNQPSLIATQSYGQSIPNALTTIVIFNETEIDLGNNFNGTSFIAPADGTYHVDAGVLMNNTAWDVGKVGTGYIYKNNNIYRIVKRYQSKVNGNEYINFGANANVWLNEGDFIDIRIFQNTGVAVNLYNSAPYNFFDVNKVT